MIEADVQSPLTAAHVDREIAEQALAVRRMPDFGVKLNRHHAVVVAHGGDRGGMRAGERSEAGRNIRNYVTVAHPDVDLVRHSLKEGMGAVGNLCARGSVLAVVGGFNRTTQAVPQQLHAIADAQHRDARFQHGGWQLGRAVVVDAGGSAGKNDSAQVGYAQRVGLVAGGEDGSDPKFSHAAGDQLAVLGAKVEHHDGLVVCDRLPAGLHHVHRCAGSRPVRGAFGLG